jgi:peptide/nickel transport system ATP-binding protein/oligopeptide transport system ATP-binding protein
MAIVLITHDLAVVAEHADRVAVMYAGRIVETGPVAEVFADPRHPYTRGLLDSVPARVGRGETLHSIKGGPPELHAVPPGCAFQARCPMAEDVCRTERPVPAGIAPGRTAACHFAKEPARA